MKFAKVLFTVSFSICLLLGPVSRVMSRNEIPGHRSGTPKNPAAVSPVSRDKVGWMVLYGTQENAKTRVPPPPLLKRSERSDFFRTEPPQLTVIYTGFTDEARAAFQYAVDICNSLLHSRVPIKVDATFTDLGGYEDGAIILGDARPASWKPHGSLNLWYVDALADQQAGRDLAPNQPDIITRFNSHADVGWYFGTDGNTPRDKMDFVSVVLHEIIHGLGFTSAARQENFATFSDGSFSPAAERGELRAYSPKLPQIYDFFVVNGSATRITRFDDPSPSLLAQLTSNNLFWDGRKGVEGNGGVRPKLYAPRQWSQGSSYAHLDEDTFPPGDANSLMTPRQDRGEVIHDPGPITLGMFEDMGWTINRIPVFTEGAKTTRRVAENTAPGVAIGRPVEAIDANNDPLTYQLRGRDAAAFDIDPTSGQLKTKAALHHETKASYTVTVTVSDGSFVNEITVVIVVIDVVEVTNSAPNFIEGSATTRTVAENTPRGVNIREPIAATDADNDPLTYTLGGRDAAAFGINRRTGQLRTRAALDYETQRVYTVRVTVSDGSLTDSITVTIDVTDVDDQKRPTLTLTSQSPLREATLNGSVVTLRLSNSVYEDWLDDPVAITGIAGVTLQPANVKRVNDTVLTVGLTFDGTDFDTDATLTFTLKAAAIRNYEGHALTATARVTAATESIAAASSAPLTETTLNGNVVTLTLNGRVYESRYTVGNNVTVSGVPGLTVDKFNVERLSDTKVNVGLVFDGTDFDTDATLTFRVGADAVAGYSGEGLIVRVSVAAVVERAPRVTAFALQPLTEATLNGSLVTLTLSTGRYARAVADIHRAVQVSGVAGVTFQQSDVIRISDTKVTLILRFNGTDFDTDAVLTFQVGPAAIAAYNGPPLVTQILVTAVIEENPTLTPRTAQPLTEATLDESLILLTLNKGTYV